MQSGIHGLAKKSRARPAQPLGCMKTALRNHSVFSIPRGAPDSSTDIRGHRVKFAIRIRRGSLSGSKPRNQPRLPAAEKNLSATAQIAAKAYGEFRGDPWTKRLARASPASAPNKNSPRGSGRK